MVSIRVNIQKYLISLMSLNSLNMFEYPYVISSSKIHKSTLVSFWSKPSYRKAQGLTDNQQEKLTHITLVIKRSNENPREKKTSK